MQVLNSRSSSVLHAVLLSWAPYSPQNKQGVCILTPFATFQPFLHSDLCCILYWPHNGHLSQLLVATLMEKGYQEMNICCKIYAVKATTLQRLENHLYPNTCKRRWSCEVTLLLRLNSELSGSQVSLCHHPCCLFWKLLQRSETKCEVSLLLSVWPIYISFRIIQFEWHLGFWDSF